MGGFREELAAGVKKAPDEPGLGWDLRVTRVTRDESDGNGYPAFSTTTCIFWTTSEV